MDTSPAVPGHSTNSPTLWQNRRPKKRDSRGVDHQVHSRRVRSILGTAQRRLDEHKSGLHEHDQEASDQHPNIVDRVQVVEDTIIQIGRFN